MDQSIHTYKLSDELIEHVRAAIENASQRRFLARRRLYTAMRWEVVELQPHEDGSWTEEVVFEGPKLNCESRAELLQQRAVAKAAAEAAALPLVAALHLVQSFTSEAQREWDADNDPRVGKMLLALAGKVPGYRPETDAINRALRSAVAPVTA